MYCKKLLIDRMRALMLFTFTNLFVHLGFAQYLARNDYNARLEPTNKVYHGVGQWETRWLDQYWANMPAGKKPSVWMHYARISELNQRLNVEVPSQIAQYEGTDQYFIPQIGLYTGDASSVTAAEVNTFVQALQTWGRPVFVRIGYEFNGPWENYTTPAGTRAIWQALVTGVRNAGLDYVSFVWCADANHLQYDFNPTGDRYIMNYYPGDEYVDWWGIDVFEVASITSTYTQQFLNLAHQHNKPVMIGEAAPAFVGVNDGQADWNTWYVPFFNLIKNNPGIKAISYINSSWYSDWQDGRVHLNPTILNNWQNELGNAIWLHGTSEANTRASWGTSTPDTQAPSAPTNLSSPEKTSTTVSLTWTASIDNIGVILYEIYRGGIVAGSISTTSFQVTGLSPSTAYSFTVKAKDAAGNVSASSPALSVTTDTTPPAGTNLLQNPGFETGTLTPWVSSHNSQIESSNTKSGGKAVSTWWGGVVDQLVTGLSPNTTYVFKGWVKNNLSGITGNIGVKDFGGAEVKTSVTELSYTEKSVSFTTGSNNTSARVVIYAPSNGLMYGDDFSLTGNSSTADTQAPSVPGSLASPAKTSTTVNLTWAASTDNVGVTGYDVYKDGAVAGSTTSTSYTVTGLTASTSYSFTVKAKDAAGNVSAASSPLAITTAVPPVSTNLLQNPGFESGALTPWTASHNTQIESANMKSGSKALSSWWGGVVNQLVTGLSPNTTYIFKGWVKNNLGGITSYIGVKDFGSAEVKVSNSSTTYVEKSVTFTTGSTNTSVRVVIYAPSNGLVYADDFSLTTASGTLLRKTIKEEEEIAAHEIESNLEIYPNPTKGRFTINYSSDTKQRFRVSITDLNSKVLVESQQNASEGLNVAEVEAEGLIGGLYLINLTPEKRGMKMIRTIIIDY